MMQNIRQFDVIDVELDPSRGSEQRGLRPCVVLESNAVCDVGRTTIIAPLTTKKTGKAYPFEVYIDPTKENGLTMPSKIKIDQVRVISVERIGKKRGRIEKSYWEGILRAVDSVFDREQMFAR